MTVNTRLPAGLTLSVLRITYVTHIPGLCRIWYRRREPDPDNPWSKCWNDMSYAARGFTECEDLIEHYEEEWGSHYEYCIRSAAWGCAPKPTMPGAPA